MLRKILLISSLTLFLVCACDGMLPPGSVPAITEHPTEVSPAEESIHIFFADPQSGLETGGPAAELVRAIEQAETSVDMAAYNLTLSTVRDALVGAAQRGVRVRLVVEKENIQDDPPLDDLEVVTDTGKGLMHHKFMIVDGVEVWTGSMNFSRGGAYHDYNHLVCIRDDQVALDYENEFEEMFLDRMFGPDSLTDTPYPDVVVDGLKAEILFSPDDNVQKRLSSLLAQAEESIYVLAYTFTADPLADLLIERAGQGVLVGMILEASRVRDSGADYERLVAAGLDVRLDGIDGLLHHKVMVVDGRTVVFGSYNFTASAEERNDENLIIVEDENLAMEFLAEYQRIAELAR